MNIRLCNRFWVASSGSIRDSFKFCQPPSWVHGGQIKSSSGGFSANSCSTWSRSSFLVKSYPFLMSKERAENPNSWAATENLGGLNTSATKSRFPWWKDAWDNSLACAFSWRRWRTGMHSVSQVFSWGRNQRSVWVLPVLLGIRVMYSRLSFLGFMGWSRIICWVSRSVTTLRMTWCQYGPCLPLSGAHLSLTSTRDHTLTPDGTCPGTALDKTSDSDAQELTASGRCLAFDD